MNIFDLGALAWEIKGTAPYVPLLGNSMETGKELEGITRWMPAQVPGGAALSLYREGYIDHPYFGMNSLKCEWIENKWWIYRTVFQKPALTGERIRLLFHGVDYECLVYLNDCFLGEHVGMYEPFDFDITEQFHTSDLLSLKVLLKHAPDEMGQIGKTSETATQKSRFNYKWDFSTRLVNLGIWQGVSLVGENQAVLEDLSVQGNTSLTGDGRISISGAVRINSGGTNLHVQAACAYQGLEVAAAATLVENGQFSMEVCIENPMLWYPNGMGAQPLYDLTLTLSDNDVFCDEHTFRIGIRRLEYLQNDDSPTDAFPYTFAVNGKRMYVKGVNLTPLDHIYGDIPAQQYAYTLKTAAEMNVNLIRVWGGGIIETEAFYDLCDEYGFLVWQEFIQSSSGIDNIPSKRPEFLNLLERTARAAVTQKRNHTCLAVWSGGNELMREGRKPVTLEDENIAMLQKIVKELDPMRLFLPTSASGPNEFISSTPNTSHDVHGWWQYQGNPHHYEFYAHSDSLFHSEFGCDGMTSLQAIPKILPEKDCSPVRMTSNDNWRFHGDWWCTYEREQRMFGKIDTLATYVKCSQWMQAEGLRYILEANRRRAFRNSGSIIWQLNEPWPNLSCTSLLNYYGEQKMAYHWAKNAFSAFHVSLDYRKLDFAPGESFCAGIFLSTDAIIPAGKAEVTVGVSDMFGVTLYQTKRTVDTCFNACTPCGSLEFPINRDFQGMFLIRINAQQGEFASESTYYFSTESEQPYKAAHTLQGAMLTCMETVCKNGVIYATIKNSGDNTALHVHVQELSDSCNLLLRDNFVTLAPGEAHIFEIRCLPKFRFGFDEYINGPGSPVPKLQVCCLGGDGCTIARQTHK